MRNLLATALTLFLLGVAPTVALAQSQVVTGFVQRAVAAQDRESMRAVVEREVDVAYLMTSALGARAQEMNAEQLQRFAVGIRGMIVDQLLALRGQAQGAQFRAGATRQQPTGTLVGGTFSIAGRPAAVFFLVRQGEQGQWRIGDLRIGADGLLASEALRGVVDQLFEINSGDVDAVLASME